MSESDFPKPDPSLVPVEALTRHPRQHRTKEQATAASRRITERRRLRRAQVPKAKVLDLRRMTKGERLFLVSLYPDDGHRLPETRGECEGGPRPCPLVSCRFNLFLDVERTGNLKMNFPGREPEDMPPGQSCVLDIADERERTLEETGEILNMTRERVRQLQQAAFDHAGVREAFTGYRDED